MRSGYPEDAQMEREMKIDPAHRLHSDPVLGSMDRAPTAMDNQISDLKNQVDKARFAVDVSEDILNKIRGPQPVDSLGEGKVLNQPNSLLEDLNQIGSRLDEAMNQLSKNLNEITELI